MSSTGNPDLSRPRTDPVGNSLDQLGHLRQMLSARLTIARLAALQVAARVQEPQQLELIAVAEVLDEVVINMAFITHYTDAIRSELPTAALGGENHLH